MKNVNDIGLFDDHFLLETLSKLGDPLQKLNEYIDWNIFKFPLDQSFINEAKDLLKGGRPVYKFCQVQRIAGFQSIYIKNTNIIWRIGK